MTETDQARLRWYLEDYLERSADPAPQVAAGVERRMADIGRSLFSAIFEANRDTIRLWSDVCDDIADTRIEISAGIREAHAFPWELLRDPRSDAPLALTSGEFVRVQSQVARIPRMADVAAGPVRILVVICRPAGADDVPFRSVAMHIVKALTEAGSAAVDLDVLRPATFAMLGQTLRRAKEKGTPYHVVHFDGHGLYIDSKGLAALNLQKMFDPRRLSAPSATDAARGYICFEDDKHPSRVQAVDGTTVGNLLYETRVPTLVLNACRSGLGASESGVTEPHDDANAPRTHEDQVRAYGSFAQSVVDAGVTGVVAMRYNVYVATAAQFVGEFYQALAQGQTLGRAANRARKHLGDERTRTVVDKPIELQDWSVPAIYEAAPMRLFPERDSAAALFDETDWSASRATAELPRQPDVGFIGRDETLLALDRAFDRDAIVLLHAYAGSGKTTTAAEFARWYSVTGGVDGPVLFSSFEQRLPLSRVVDQIGTRFAPLLEAKRVPWLTLDDDRRRTLAIEILKQNPALWIWDNVEQITGFPSGAESAWTEDEQADLRDFLRDLAHTKAKVLLTSRRDETNWLGDLPVRVRVPPMSWQDRRLLATAIIRRRHSEMRNVDVMTPLLEFSQGNPLTLTVVIRQALRDGVATRDAADAMVERLRNGEAAFDENEEQGRSRSLGASLAYGFDRSFSEAERKRLALLHLFQSVVDVGILARLEAISHGDPGIFGGPDTHMQEWAILLNRAAEIGLLTKLGDRLFSVHPALPWYFKKMFDSAYPENDGDVRSPLAEVSKIFVTCVVSYCSFARHNTENQSVGRFIVKIHEPNLLHARRLAERHCLWQEYLSATWIIRNSYDSSGRHAESRRIAIATIERMLDPVTMVSREGLEEYRFATIGMAHSLACQDARVSEANRLFGMLEERVETEFGSPIAEIQPQDLSPQLHEAAQVYVHAVRMHIASIVGRKATDQLEKAAQLGETVYQLALGLDLENELGPMAMHIGHCYADIDQGEQNIEVAQEWYERALDHLDSRDSATRSMCKYELAQLRYKRFHHAIVTTNDVSVVQERFNGALAAALEAKDTQEDGYPQAEMHLNLLIGNILDDGGYYSQSKIHQENAAVHYEKAIQIAEGMHDLLGAAMGCREMARLKLRMKEFDEALIYARSSLSRAGELGPGGAHVVALSRALIEFIETVRHQQGEVPS
ncbi:CHAT domain-containing protein [Mesorhizobium sp. AR02]|uniref:CHAT domain-containing protein n=1 Tax=Mesorhizobium sp. AR02 TaxID=2865837 RepID=UPI00215FC145|nr:CHAT domain-containing protein [Mesorhizobium sp. AR02]UVK53848.1 CHAT domain-containing protein [Mesorhizobium sp. AR02]